MSATKNKIAKINEHIAELEAKRAELEAKLATEVNLDEAVAGALVTITVGRGETKRELRGVIHGVKSNEKTTFYKVLVGEGADAEFITVFGSQITALTPVAPALPQ